MSDIEWKDPPEDQLQKIDVVIAELRSRPGEWAKIAHAEGISFGSRWWYPLFDDYEYETRVALINPAQVFGPREIYAKFIGKNQP